MAEDGQDPDAMERLRANPDLEEQVRKMAQSNLHPLVEKIQHKFGVFNIIRNARNQKQVDVDRINQEESGS